MAQNTTTITDYGKYHLSDGTRAYTALAALRAAVRHYGDPTQAMCESGETVLDCVAMGTLDPWPILKSNAWCDDDVARPRGREIAHFRRLARLGLVNEMIELYEGFQSHRDGTQVPIFVRHGAGAHYLMQRLCAASTCGKKRA